MTPIFLGQRGKKYHVRVTGKSNQGDKKKLRGFGTAERERGDYSKKKEVGQVGQRLLVMQ